MKFLESLRCVKESVAGGDCEYKQLNEFPPGAAELRHGDMVESSDIPELLLLLRAVRPFGRDVSWKSPSGGVPLMSS